MKANHKFAIAFLTFITLAFATILYPYAINSAILDPKGLIALREQDLMYIASLLMLIVVIPVFILTFAICWRYRASNKSAEYDPNWHDDSLAETIWWGFPCLIILILSVVTWKSSYELDPFKPFHSSIKPLRIQVVALQWKWLFIYPEQKIASLNYFQFPEGTPLNFEITADAPMNSFWVPQLGGQVYAMPGMSTKLHLQAFDFGDFRGSSANLSGTGFAGMHFIARAGSHDDFDDWVKSVTQGSNTLDEKSYTELIKPTQNDPVVTYILKDDGLYDQIVMKYMMPQKENADG